MKNTGTTVVKDKGFMIPEDILTQCLANQTSLGVAMQIGECFDVQRSQMTLSKEHATQLNEGLKDNDCILFFQTGTNPKLEGDVNPFVMLENSSAEPILLAFIDGDVSRYADEATDHNALHNAASELRERIKRVYSQHNGDLKETLSDLYQDEIFAKDVMSMIDGDRGSITFWGVNDDPFHFTISTDETVLNDPTIGFWASNFGKVEAKIEEKPKGLAGLMGGILGTKPKPVPAALAAAPAPSASLRNTAKATQRSTTREAYVPPVASTAKPVVTAPGTDGGKTSVPVQPGTSVPSVGPNPDEILHLNVPNSVKQKHGKWTGFVRKNTPGGILPPDWKDIKTISCKRSEATQAFMNNWTRDNPKGLKAVADVKVEPAKATVAAPVTAKAEEKPIIAQVGSRPDRHAVDHKKADVKAAEPAMKKDVVSHTVSQSNKGMIEGPIPLLAPGPKAKLLEILASPDFIAAQDRQAQGMSDPKKFKELEDRIPDLGQQLGLKSLRDTDAWPFEYLLKIGKDVGIEALAILAANWRSEAMHWQQFADSLMADKNDTSGTGNVKVEEQVPLKATGTSGPARTSLRHSVARRAM